LFRLGGSAGNTASFVLGKGYQLGVRQQDLTKLFSKKNFTVDDANRILAVLDHQIEVNIVPIKKA